MLEIPVQLHEELTGMDNDAAEEGSTKESTVTVSKDRLPEFGKHRLLNARHLS